MLPKAQLKPGDPPPAIKLVDTGGNQAALEALWAGGPTLLTFLRHFG